MEEKETEKEMGKGEGEGREGEGNCKPHISLSYKTKLIILTELSTKILAQHEE